MSPIARSLLLAVVLLTPTAIRAQARTLGAPEVASTRNALTARFVGQKTGAFPGPADGVLTCLKLSHSIVSPRDAASGLPTGKRMHKPLVLTVRSVSKSLLKLYSILANNENLNSVVFSLSGSDYSVLTLSNASVASIDTLSDADGLYFAIAFTYQKIRWEKDGVVFTDDWEAPVV
jgi:type VI secretion system secreted protein Hcp